MDYLYFIIPALLSMIFLFIRYKYSYWQLRNVPHLPPVFPLGKLNQLTSFNMLEKLNEIYNQFKNTSPVAGIYLFTKPAVVALDLELIKAILIKDFPIFSNRMIFSNPARDPLSRHLFHMEGAEWKKMRAKLSPTFTSGKMKFMFPTMVGVANKLKDLLENKLKISNDIEIREVLARYTMDIIGTCVFGIQSDCLKDSNTEFCHYGRRFIEKPHKSVLLRMFFMTFNELAQKIGISTHDPKGTQFFTNLIKETIDLREANNIQRNDFMNLLIQLKNQTSADGLDGLAIDEITAQAFAFFIAGFETSASNMTFSLFELALQPALQGMVREEIFTVLEKHNNELCYEAVSEMTYLNQCIYETMRKYPALVSLSRKANEAYHIPGTKLVIEKGTPVLIPVRAIHYDANIYPNPTKYDPDRFNSDNIKARDAMTFLGFGDGPRNCIGLRFGRMQVQIGLITLLRSFKFSVAEKTPQEISLNRESFILLPKESVWLKVEAI